MVVAVLAVAFALGTASTVAAATAPRPDAHDRALALKLGGTVATFQAVTSKTSDDNQLQKTLKNCAFLKKDPAQAFAAVFALVPVLLINVVSQYKSPLTDVRDTLTKMRPHAPLFRRWLAAEVQSLNLILQFDNHGL